MSQLGFPSSLCKFALNFVVSVIKFDWQSILLSNESFPLSG